MRTFRKCKHHFAHPKRQENEAEVINGLAITPSDMYTMMKEGKPITTANLPDNQFFDGEVNPSFDVDPALQKGVDPADLWENEQEIKYNFRKRSKKSLENEKGD